MVIGCWQAGRDPQPPTDTLLTLVGDNGTEGSILAKSTLLAKRSLDSDVVEYTVLS